MYCLPKNLPSFNHYSDVVCPNSFAVRPQTDSAGRTDFVPTAAHVANFSPSTPGERFQKCAVSVSVVSIKTAAMWKKRKAGTTKYFPVFREKPVFV